MLQREQINLTAFHFERKLDVTCPDAELGSGGTRQAADGWQAAVRCCSVDAVESTGSCSTHVKGTVKVLCHADKRQGPVVGCIGVRLRWRGVRRARCRMRMCTCILPFPTSLLSWFSRSVKCAGMVALCSCTGVVRRLSVNAVNDRAWIRTKRLVRDHRAQTCFEAVGRGGGRKNVGSLAHTCTSKLSLLSFTRT